MAKQKKTFFDLEFKEEAVRLASDPNRRTKDVAAELGVHPFSISRWKKEFRDKKNGKAKKASGEPKDARVKYLERKLARTEEQNEILKKAIAIFSQDQKQSIGLSKDIGVSTQ